MHHEALDRLSVRNQTLSPDGGDGFLISYPDFAECILDGETVGEAIVNGADALKATIAALKVNKQPVPQLAATEWRQADL